MTEPLVIQTMADALLGTVRALMPEHYDEGQRRRVFLSALGTVVENYASEGLNVLPASDLTLIGFRYDGRMLFTFEELEQ